MSDVKLLFESRKSIEPLVSVVVMLRNEATTIPLVLDSLLCQETEFEFEAIFVDGCSTDSSVEIIKKHALTQKVSVKILLQPADNTGMTVAQNEGAKEAAGKYLLFVQSDVRFTDKKAIAKVADAFRDPSVVGTSFVQLGVRDDFRKYDFWGQVFMARYHGVRGEGAYDLKFNGVRKTVFEDLGGFDEDHLPLGGNDFEFNMRLREKGAIVETGVEVEHLHGFGKKYSALGMIKKVCRNSEVTGVTTPTYFKHRKMVRGNYWVDILQKFATVFLCLSSLVPYLWPWSVLLVLLAGLVWNWAAIKHIRNWRLIFIPLYSFVVMYVFSFYFLRGLLIGKTLYEFDNKMN